MQELAKEQAITRDRQKVLLVDIDIETKKCNEVRLLVQAEEAEHADKASRAKVC